MGIGYFELKWLERERPLGEVLTLGRQRFNLPSNRGGFADEALARLGATSVDALDFSDFEGASYLGDLNEPLQLGRQFETIIDFGTTEHVFNVAMALQNCIRLCKIGGRILHALPSNADCGHGFYQFGPELFFSLYSERNGFSDTEVFIADLMDERHWWRASPPPPGLRLMANSLYTSYVLVRTVKKAERELRVVQSDYEQAWDAGDELRVGGKFDRIMGALKKTPLRQVTVAAYRSMFAATALTRFNPNLKKIPVVQQLPRVPTEAPGKNARSGPTR